MDVFVMDLFTSQKFMELTIMHTFQPDFVNERAKAKPISEVQSLLDAEGRNACRKRPGYIRRVTGGILIRLGQFIRGEEAERVQ